MANEITISAPVEIEAPRERGLSALGGIEDMARKLRENSDRLAMVHEYIADNFISGIDFGPADNRNTKPVLLKPGAEKVCKLFNTSPRWRRDTDTWEMLGKPAGTVCYICEIIDNRTNSIIGEGRGAEKIGNRGRDANKAIKIAEKCALVDAALYTFNLSERFTQDTPQQRDNLNSEKAELVATVEDMRTGVESSMTTNQFLRSVAMNYLHKMPDSIGAVRKLRRAIVDDGMYDLATGERIPD
jgi:hypothetical protein